MFKKKLIAGLAIAMMMSATTGCGSNRTKSDAAYLGSSNSYNYGAAATEAP